MKTQTVHNIMLGGASETLQNIIQKTNVKVINKSDNTYSFIKRMCLDWWT